MTATTFAGSSAVRALLTARDTAAARSIDLRMVIPAPAVLRILRVYPSLSAPLAPAPAPGQLRDARRGESGTRWPARNAAGDPACGSRRGPLGHRYPAGW
jgi:hypothetical protein